MAHRSRSQHKWKEKLNRLRHVIIERVNMLKTFVLFHKVVETILMRSSKSREQKFVSL